MSEPIEKLSTVKGRWPDEYDEDGNLHPSAAIEPWETFYVLLMGKEAGDKIHAPREVADTLKRLGFAIVPLETTEDMLNAARDWSYEKYGKPIGNDAAIGCYQAMLKAALSLHKEGE